MRNLLATVFTACLASGAASAADVGDYYTLFTPSDAYKVLDWSACTGGSCYATGTLGSSFIRVCAVLEGKPKVQGNVWTRDIYVLDKAHREEGSQVHLYIYTRTDTFGSGGDDVSIVQNHKLTVGVGSHGLGNGDCMMAQNDKFLFVGVNGGGYQEINRHTFEMSTTGQLIYFLTADNNGYVTAGSINGEFYTYDKDGNLVQNGGGASVMTDTKNAPSFVRF